MNLFKSVLAVASGGGDGADLIVTCSSSFAGKTITCTNGSDYTETKECPSSSPYEVTFESIPTGTYTISGVISGQTFSTTKTILDFTANLNSIPNGATVTPTDSIQTWLHCANIWDKNYTTISQVLSDNTTLLALISSNNAADYMARSMTWASTVCANQTAMGYIGNNDYCAEALLANSTWGNAICNSTYFESVLNKKIPTMTSDSAPSGNAYSSSLYDTGDHAYYAFDNNDTTQYQASTSDNNATIRYTFNSSSKVAIKKVVIKTLNTSVNGWGNRAYNFDLQASTDGTNWDTLQQVRGNTQLDLTYLFPSNTTKYLAIQMSGLQSQGNGGGYGSIYTLQAYGR